MQKIIPFLILSARIDRKNHS